jgi:hypothetical protein
MAHSKKFLAPHAEAHFKDIQKAAGLLAMVPSTNVERYQVWPFGTCMGAEQELIVWHRNSTRLIGGNSWPPRS